MTVPALGSGPDDTVDPAVLTTLAQACRDAERCRFGHTPAGGSLAARHVEPHRLVPFGRRWYLVAHDLDRHAWRSFRLDRISGVSTTGSRFRPRELPSGDAARFVRDGVSGRTGELEVEVVVHADADDVRSRIGQWVDVVDDGPGWCVARMTPTSLHWPLLGTRVGRRGVHRELAT